MTSRDKRRLAAALGRFPVFASCDRGDLEALAGAGRVTRLPACWTFVHEGTPADACYVLLDGTARVLIGGSERACLGPGAVLGEMALLGHCLRGASVVSGTAVEVLRLDYDALSVLFHAHPRLQECMAALRAQRLVEAGGRGPHPASRDR